MSEPSDRTREILKKVRQIEIRTRRMVTDAMAGAYHSVFKGQGMDFEEVREYAPGDDVRSIDWNVTAKMDRPFIKKFREERELTIMLLVDLSASGGFGSSHESKRELAAELASVLAFSAVRNSDKVGLILFTDRIEEVIVPKKGRQHVLRVIREILFHEPEGTGTDIPLALTTMNRLLKRRAVVFLISDFLQGTDGELPDPDKRENGDLFHTLSLTNQRHDLTGIVLSDPREESLPDVGILTLEDAETGELIELNTSSEMLRRQYKQQNMQRRADLERGLRRSGVGTFNVRTGEPYLLALRQYFAKRMQRR